MELLNKNKQRVTYVASQLSLESDSSSTFKNCLNSGRSLSVFRNFFSSILKLNTNLESAIFVSTATSIAGQKAMSVTKKRYH